MRPLLAMLLVLALSVPAVASAAPSNLLSHLRKAEPQHLSILVERLVLPNGLVVLLAPDDTTSSVLVSMAFRAGTLYEPPERSGLAHLAEHAMATGLTPDANYAAMIEERHGRFFNAFTTFDTMSFDTIVPARELPLALWVQYDRLLALPGRIDAPSLELHRKVVLEERALRLVDEPYGLVDEHVFGQLFARPHPLHGGVLGTVDELSRITAEEVRAFVTTHLVPANAVLTIAGNFDAARVKRLLDEGLARIPGGKRVETPRLPALRVGPPQQRREPLSRQPRLTLAWRFPGMTDEYAPALQLGAQLLTLYVDGAWGMRIGADFALYTGEGLFRMDVVLPYDEPVRTVESNAEGFLRMLTRSEMPDDLTAAAHLALDRAAMFGLDTLQGRAQLLSRLELLHGRSFAVSEHLSKHWELERSTVRDTARVFLSRPKVQIHARPLRPRAARAEREE